MNQTQLADENGNSYRSDSAGQILAGWAVKICAALIVLFSGGLGVFAVLMVTEVGSPVRPLLGLALVMMLGAVRLFAMRRWAAAALPVLLWSFTILNLAHHDVWLWVAGLATGSALLTLAVVVARQNLRRGF